MTLDKVREQRLIVRRLRGEVAGLIFEEGERVCRAWWEDVLGALVRYEQRLDREEEMISKESAGGVAFLDSTNTPIM